VADSSAQPNFDQRSFERLRERLQADLPALERLVTAIREFCSQKPALSTSLPCKSCPKSGMPHDPCERLEAYLDGVYRGKLHGETTFGVNLDEVLAQKAGSGQEDGDETARKRDRGTFRRFRKVEPFDAMESYKPCWHLLSHKQREVVHLHYGKRKRNSEIGVLLDKKPSTVSGLLKRAKKIKEEYDAEMRRQEFKLQRELETKFGEI